MRQGDGAFKVLKPQEKWAIRMDPGSPPLLTELAKKTRPIHLVTQGERGHGGGVSGLRPPLLCQPLVPTGSKPLDLEPAFLHCAKEEISLEAGLRERAGLLAPEADARLSLPPTLFHTGDRVSTALKGLAALRGEP